jgi:hypothetical protein
MKSAETELHRVQGKKHWNILIHFSRRCQDKKCEPCGQKRKENINNKRVPEGKQITVIYSWERLKPLDGSVSRH